MLGRKNKQKDFYDSYVYENLLPAEHILLDIKEQIDFSFVDEELKDLYDPQLGRPSYPPQMLFKMLFLEFYYNLSDVEVAKQCKYNILYRYFTGLQIHDPTPDDTTLVVFRARCGQQRFERLFDRIVELCRQKGLLEGKLKLIDATSVVADIAIPNTVNLLRQGRRVILKKLEKSKPKLATKLVSKYVTKEHLPGKPTEEQLREEMAKTREFASELKGQLDQELTELLDSLESIATPEGDKTKLVSFVDPDATNGAANSKKMFTGYKAHIAQDESRIVTSCDTLQAHQNEGHQLPKLLEKEQQKGLRSKAVAADSIYSSYDNRKLIHDQKMKAYIPKRKSNTKMHKLGFKYLQDEDKLLCPAGQLSISKTRDITGEVYYFTNKVCRGCHMYDSCKISDSHPWVRIGISDDYKEYLVDRDANYSQAQAKRRQIEPKIGEAKKWHGLGKARYRGKWRVATQVLMTFSVINVKRMIKLLKERTVPAPSEAILVTEPG